VPWAALLCGWVRFGVTWGPGGGHRQKTAAGPDLKSDAVRDLFTFAWACRRRELTAAATLCKTEPRGWLGQRRFVVGTESDRGLILPPAPRFPAYAGFLDQGQTYHLPTVDKVRLWTT
jgi:hypothetical protein